MTEERSVYQSEKSAEEFYLEEEMRSIDLHAGMRNWVRAAYRLKGLKYAVAILNAWRK